MRVGACRHCVYESILDYTRAFSFCAARYLSYSSIACRYKSIQPGDQLNLTARAASGTRKDFRVLICPRLFNTTERRICFMTQRLIRDTRGVTALEYGIIASILGLVLVAIFQGFGSTLSSLFSSVGSQI
jgi:pilus assembly protein Flp/PilA